MDCLESYLAYCTPERKLKALIRLLTLAPVTFHLRCLSVDIKFENCRYLTCYLTTTTTMMTLCFISHIIIRRFILKNISYAHPPQFFHRKKFNSIIRFRCWRFTLLRNKLVTFSGFVKYQISILKYHSHVLTLPTFLFFLFYFFLFNLSVAYLFSRTVENNSKLFAFPGIYMHIQQKIFFSAPTR